MGPRPHLTEIIYRSRKVSGMSVTEAITEAPKVEMERMEEAGI
jgi:hypothetical protein